MANNGNSTYNAGTNDHTFNTSKKSANNTYVHSKPNDTYVKSSLVQPDMHKMLQEPCSRTIDNLRDSFYGNPTTDGIQNWLESQPTDLSIAYNPIDMPPRPTEINDKDFVPKDILDVS